jgi:hypothetical protein
MLAAFLWSKDSPTPMTSGDGALIGAFTGLFAAGAHTLISIPLAAINVAFFKNIFERLSSYTNEMPAGWREWFDQSIGPFSIAGFFLGLMVSAVVFSILGALGGILGLALFGKKAPAAGAPPLPPPGPAV